jgi:hypothetical protein
MIFICNSYGVHFKWGTHRVFHLYRWLFLSSVTENLFCITENMSGITENLSGIIQIFQMRPYWHQKPHLHRKDRKYLWTRTDDNKISSCYLAHIINCRVEANIYWEFVDIVYVSWSWVWYFIILCLIYRYSIKIVHIFCQSFLMSVLLLTKIYSFYYQ